MYNCENNQNVQLMKGRNFTYQINEKIIYVNDYGNVYFVDVPNILYERSEYLFLNKEHWNTIIISDKIDVSLAKELIEQSYELTKSKKVK